ncbi:HAD-IA family hydrolase [Lactococcus hircilactis]|uniref:HAD-IA family hydrolase n=1 Tax=Lactococcus hircilactis TaxID=1494462 RepID=A0A7X2D0N2_9LACT|nr:HAD family hydrolase [Lactococcus hircilactis]MQW40104.1 HAD-IA family hydrolase [Lactococcus hircilactis]
MFKNIIFDWDNTLFPLKKYWNLAHRRIFLELLPLDTVTIDEFMAQYLIFDQKIWEQIHQGEISVAFGREERVRLVLDYFDIPYKPLFIKNFFDIYLTALIDEIKRDDVLVDRLLTLSKTYAISILSNGGSWEQREKIRQFGFEGMFPVYISEEVGLQKPDEAIFKCVLKNEHYAVSETLMVGDTLVHDIIPAQKLGMTGVYIGQEKETGATFEFQTIADFLDAIEKNELKK